MSCTIRHFNIFWINNSPRWVYNTSCIIICRIC
nr:MAG TPA: hypothetical protein [Caudoviricetes sp.]